MKKLALLIPLTAIVFMACQQSPVFEPAKALGTFEMTFDLDSKTVQMKNLSRVGVQAVRLPSAVSFTAPATLGFLADATRGVNYISATFGVNNLTASALTDLTLIAYKKTGNASDTALKSIVDFNGTPLNAAQLETFARSVQPTNMPSSVSPVVVNSTIADLQVFQESELTSLQTAANTANELSTASGDYLFPYGFIARTSSTSRVIAGNSTNGKLTVAIKLPNNNEPSSANARRFSMTFVAFDQPLGAGVTRMTESYEERFGTSSAATRANGSNFNISSANIAQIAANTVSSGILVNGVRTSGSSTDVKRILGERSRQVGSTSQDEWYSGVVTDSSENVYVAGVAYAAVDGQTYFGNSDLILVKYNSSGVKQWTKQFGTTGEDYPNDLAIDSSGNLYVTGYTDATAAFTNTEVWIAKYDSNGVQQWSQSFGSGVNDFGNGIATDSGNNVYVTGYTLGDIDGAGTGTHSGNADIFTTKYNSSGTRQWIGQIGTGFDDIGNGVGTDSSGNAYVAGKSSGNFDGNTTTGGSDIVLIKYNTSGVKQWSREFGTTTNEEAFDIALDSSGNSYMTGYTTGNLDGNTNAGSQDFFLVKFNSSGTKQWTREIGSSTTDYPDSVAVDATGNNVFMSGYTAGSVDGLTNAGSNDIIIAKYNAAGTKQWLRQIGTSAYDHTDGGGLTVGASSDAYVVGSTASSFAGATNAGNGDYLLLRFNGN